MPESRERDTRQPVFHRYDPKRRTIVTVVVNYQIHTTICNIEIYRIHNINLLKKEERSDNLAMPLFPPSRQPL